VKHWDAIIVGAGIIGLSLAIELTKRGLKVLLVEKGEPGREASWAAGGMLADFLLETPPELRELATASARMYPEFVHELEDESRLKIDLRGPGAFLFTDSRRIGSSPACGSAAQLEASHPSPDPLHAMEPNLRPPAHAPICLYLEERSVDPRQLTSAALGAAKHRGIDISSGNPVIEVLLADGKTAGVRTTKTRYAAPIVINCAGAWAGQIAIPGGDGACSIPTRPVKGQMLCVIMPQKEFVRHVIRTPDVYLIPRSDGRLLIGATQEEAGFDKHTVPGTIQRLHQAALDIVPKLSEARFLEAWAGLRPGTPDALPILGPTSTPGYFFSTGHFRDGILLAPVTARLMRQVLTGEKPEFDLSAFMPARFSSASLSARR
jgi:glycine oxidase